MSIKCGVVGYGPAFNMGRFHADIISKTPGLELKAIVDINPERLRVAKKDFPWVETYSSIDDMLDKSDVECVTIVTPHNTHASLAIKALKAGRHVIVEKPMCITVDEADQMINEAKKSGMMLTVFHNRRLDGSFLSIKEIVDGGLIGKVFHIEAFGGGYGHPGYWWRSDKKVSGGAFYDWGAHFIDWILNIVPERIKGVYGHFYKLVWNDVTNEDHVEATIIFESGVKANLQLSNIAIVKKPRWRILGTNGGILDEGDGKLKVYRHIDGLNYVTEVKYNETNWAKFYVNIVEHLVNGKELLVKPEEARRVIEVIEAAEKSSKNGELVKLKYE